MQRGSFSFKVSSVSLPYLIVEVFSKSTFNYDSGTERNQYQKTDTVHKIILSIRLLIKS